MVKATWNKGKNPHAGLFSEKPSTRKPSAAESAYRENMSKIDQIIDNRRLRDEMSEVWQS